MATDIKNTGYQNYRDLQKQNQEVFNPETATPEDWYKELKKQSFNSYSDQPIESVGLQAAEAGYGNSQFDEALTSASQLEDIGDIRYSEQPWYDTLANGVGKMLGTAGTTFVSSLVGLPYGIGAAINEGRWSALWDNDVTQGLADVDKWLENNMTNYRSQVQQNSPWYDPNNLFSMNFIADDVIKNMGFTLGAAASMAVGSGTLGLMSKALGKVNEVSNASKMTKNVMSALFSATGEGMIEARQGVEERNKLELQKLEDALQPEVEALRQEFNAVDAEYAANRGHELVQGADGKMYDPAYENYRQRMQELEAKKAELDRKRALGQQQIEESGREMGNKILLGNQVLLTAGNLIQFSKAMTKSYDKARHAAEQSAKVAKPSGVTATRVSNNLKDGYKISSPVPGRIKAATKGIVTEGSEEMNQQFIQSASGAAYNEVDANDYWRAKMDQDSYRETTKGLYTMGQILDRGFQESWGDINQWEQFVIGGLTGAMGSYSPTKLFNQDKSKSVWNPMRYGSWEGGAYNELKDFNNGTDEYRGYNEYKENIEALNKIMASEDFPARMSNLVGHTYTEKEKEYLAEQGDKKGWKDADDKQNIMDIQAFLRAGKLDDLRAIYQEMSGELSDDDIENIVKSTTREVTAEEDKQNFEKQADEQIAQRQARISELQQKAQDIADQQETLEVGERGEYQVALIPALEDIFADIDKEYDAISNLEQQKTDYTPQKYYEGAYVTREGNRTATNDEIRAEHKHNAEELNRKLDSYLESIDYVNRRTGGQLTKDQEDNLAYLHNMGKESNVRMQKIMANVRQQLPKKFLLKTNKTPEQLTKENASSDLTFTKDEQTKEGYVEVDTSLMNDASFADFFQREVMRGGNINPEFAETADEKAAREEEEKNLSEEERKEKAKERISNKWQKAVKQMEADADEQWDTNWGLLVDNFMTNYRQGGNATIDETAEAFGKIKQDLQDASDLFDQAGEFQKTLDEYMRNPGLVDKAKEKEEKKAEKAEQEQRRSNQFEGKDAKQMTQELAEGVMDEDEFFNFANMDLSGDAPEPMKVAQQEAKKTQEIRQRQASLKNHIQEQLGENPSAQDLEVAEIAMQMVDNAAMNAASPEDMNLAVPEFTQVPVDNIPPDANIEDVDYLNMSVQSKLAEAFNAMEEDRNARNDIPDEAPAPVEGEERGAETGHDPVSKTVAASAVPFNGTATRGATQNKNTRRTATAIPTVSSEIPVTYTSKRGREVQGKYDVSTEDDGSIEVSHSGNSATQRTIKQSDLEGTNISTEDIIGKQEDYGTPEDYNKSKAAFEGDGFKIESVTISPDNTVTVNTDEDQFELKGEKAETFIKKVFPELSDRKPVSVENTESGETEDVTQNVVPKSPLTEGALRTIIDAVSKTYEQPSSNGTWRSTTTRHPYGSSSGTYHEDIAKKQYGENSKEYKRSKAIWEYLNNEHAFDRQENTDNDKINAEDTVHFMVKNFAQEMYNKDFGDLTDEEKLYSLAIIMLNDNGEVLGDLPLAELEPSFRAGNPTQQVKDLKALQDKVFNKYTGNYEMHGTDEAIVDSVLHKEGIDNLNLTFDNAKKTPLVSKVKQVMRGAVPFSRTERHTLNEVANGQPFELGVRVTGTTVAKKRGDKAQHKEIVFPGVGNVGQPYFLLKTASGEQMAIPFYMPMFNPEQHRNTELYKLLYNAVYQMLANNTQSAKGKEAYRKHMDVIAGLLQVKAGEGKRVVEVTPDHIALHFISLTDPDKEINVQIQKTDNLANDTQALVNQMTGIPINVSLQFLNDKIETGMGDTDKYVRHYNQVIGEIADINLPQNTQHTVNSWFTIELSTTAGIKPSRRVQPRITGKYNEVVGGRNVEFDTDNLTAYDTAKGEFIEGDPQIDLMLAEIQASKPINRDKKRIQVSIGGSLRTYDIEKKKFVKETETSTQAPPIQAAPSTAAAGAVGFETEAPTKTETPQQPSAPINQEGESLEQIEKRMKDNKVVGRQTKDAWNAIPEELKKKLVNEGAYLQLSYGNTTETIAFNNLPAMKEALKDANMAAKAGSLTVTEAPKPMERDSITVIREKERAARRWLAKNLPMLSSEERTQFVDKLARMGDNADKYWGSYRSGVVQIQRNAPMGTVYHEAFHYVMDMVLSDEERRTLLQLTKDELGITDDWIAEERLANDFRRYAMDENATGIMGRIKRWLRKIADRINRYNRISEPTINQLFWKINNGEFAQKSREIESFEKQQQRVLSEIRNVQKEKVAWNNLSPETKDALIDSGLSEAAYQNMSLEEKQQYIKCRV